MIKQLSVALLVMFSSQLSSVVIAEDKSQVESQQRVYGSELMTQQERIEHRNRLQAATTEKQRQQIRNEHHERMKERARAKGVELSDTPPADRGGVNAGTSRGMRDGMGKGMGSGMGNGMGGGSGKGRN